nr:MAG TPA: hypothetical protein [Caudoviricetes sp.]
MVENKLKYNRRKAKHQNSHMQRNALLLLERLAGRSL